MAVVDEIEAYFTGLPQTKQDDLRALHQQVLNAAPGCRLWFLDGRDADGKVVTNPNVGYGETRIRYAGGETRDFYRIGLSANATGVSIYVMGLADKRELSERYSGRLGKAKITGYCIRFRRNSDLDADVLEEVVRNAMALTPA